jgi:hypothetical protein
MKKWSGSLERLDHSGHCGILPHGDVATSHKAIVSSHWQRRRLQWRQAQEATRDSDNSDHTERHFELVTKLGQSRSSNAAYSAQPSLCSVRLQGQYSVQCKSYKWTINDVGEVSAALIPPP